VLLRAETQHPGFSWELGLLGWFPCLLQQSEAQLAPEAHKNTTPCLSHPTDITHRDVGEGTPWAGEDRRGS